MQRQQHPEQQKLQERYRQENKKGQGLGLGQGQGQGQGQGRSFYNIFCDSLQLYAAASSFNEMLGSSDSHDEEEESERLPERSERSEQMGVMDTGGTESSAAHLRNFLTECAEFVAQCSWQRADRMISILSTRGSTRGDSTERLVAQFTRALRQRSDLALGRLPPPPPAAGATERELESAYLCLNQVTPFIRFAHLTANQAILEALDTDSPSIHVVDINIMQGVQWPPFMQALAERPGGPPSHIRLTGAGPDAEALRKTGRRLERFADTLGLRFEFNPWIIDDDISSLAISTRPGESLAINCVLHLHELLDEAHNERLKNFLVRIRSLEPKVVALAEREADHNRPSFTDRFVEALNHYSILFDSLEATLPPKSQERLDVEQVCFGREITNIVAMEGPGRNERHQKFERWSEVMNECGFTSLPLSEFALSQARLLLRLHYPSEGYQLHTQNKAAFLGWQNSPLFSVSSWH